MTKTLNTTISKINLLLFLGLCLGVSNKLYAANLDVDDEKDGIDYNDNQQYKPMGNTQYPKDAKKRVNWRCAECYHHNKFRVAYCEKCNVKRFRYRRNDKNCKNRKISSPLLSQKNNSGLNIEFTGRKNKKKNKHISNNNIVSWIYPNIYEIIPYKNKLPDELKGPKKNKKLIDLLIDEVIGNGYQRDLCLRCKEPDTCNHEEVKERHSTNTLRSLIPNKLKKYKKKKNLLRNYSKDAGALMLALLLYTRGDCKDDLCESQRNGDYGRWKILDYCLWHAANCLSKENKHSPYKLCYIALTDTNLQVRNSKGLYFPTYVSATVKKEVAKGSLGKEGGVIIEIDQNVPKPFICCDVSWISNFPNECEILFARTAANMKKSMPADFSIESRGDNGRIKMLLLKKQLTYEVVYKDLISKISDIIGWNKLKDTKTTSPDVYLSKLFKKLIAGEADMPKEWDVFRHQQQPIIIDIKYMYKHYKEFSDQPWPFDKNVLRVDEVAEIFPEVTQIICKDIDYNNDKEEKIYQLDDTKYNLPSMVIVSLLERLNKIKSKTKLNKITIKTKNKIADDCNLYATEFAKLGWQIVKGYQQIILKKTTYDDCICKINFMIQAKRPPYEVTVLDVSIFKQLINGGNKNIPQQFSLRNKPITIDIALMYHSYKAFMPLLTDINCKNLLRFDKIANIFPNVTEIICKETDYVGKEAKSGYSNAIVCSNFILDLQKKQLKNMMSSTKLKEIIIQTKHQIKWEECILYPIDFAEMRWEIAKEGQCEISLTKKKRVRALKPIIEKGVIPVISSIITAKTLDQTSTTLPLATVSLIFKKLIKDSKDMRNICKAPWKRFRYKQERIRIDMQYMDGYYQAFIPLLCSAHPKLKNLLLFDTIAKIFPNIIEIICEDTDWDRDKMDEDGNEEGDYSAAIVGSDFICGIKHQLSTMDKEIEKLKKKVKEVPKLQRIIIRTKAYQIGNDCNLYATEFAKLGWKIAKGLYSNQKGSAKKHNQITLVRLNGSVPGAHALSDEDDQKSNEYQAAESENDVFDID